MATALHVLLAARWTPPDAVVRKAGLEVNDHDQEYIPFLDGKALEVLDWLNLPCNPDAISGATA